MTTFSTKETAQLRHAPDNLQLMTSSTHHHLFEKKWRPSIGLKRPLRPHNLRQRIGFGLTFQSAFADMDRK